jgi:excinuclease ABC subunit C
VGTRRRFESTLEHVPGVGQKTRTALLKAFGSINAIRDASEEALLGVTGVTRKQARALRSWFAEQLKPEDDARGEDGTTGR